jgi:hypothetical protein
MTTIEFPHKAPKGMHYEVESFKRNVDAIWICYDREFDYNLGKPVKCIWGFYNTKTKEYYSPVNAKTVGKIVRVNDTTPYTAMPLKYNPLTAAFV